MSSLAIFSVLFAVATAQYKPDPSQPWMNTADSPEKRAQILLDNMELADKVRLMHGNNTNGEYVGLVPYSAHLNIPSINLNDGPQGFRSNAYPGTTTAWPSGMTIGTTFDLKRALAWGTSMGEEFLGKGANVQLGPGVCLARVPNCGRLFEYISGEDPYVGYSMVQPVITGIQSMGVIANAKHFILNSQETNRNTQTAIIDERTFFEMYMPPFAGAVEAEVGSIMCSYNKINNTWSCENPVTLGKDFKEVVGFKGWVMSDWGATHSASINAGLDQEMPSSNYMAMNRDLGTLIQNGNVSMAKVNDTTLRILTPMFKMGIFDRPQTNQSSANVTSAAHNAVARDLASASTVLLKNDDNTLPLSIPSAEEYAVTGTPFVVAVIGGQAANPVVHGGGSGSVTPYYSSAPLDALRKELGIEAFPAPANNCSQADWDVGTDFLNQDDQTEAAASSVAECCELCAGRSGPVQCTAFSFTSDGQCWMKSTHNNPQPNPKVTAGIVTVSSGPARSCSADGSRCIVYNDGSDITSAAAAAASADVAMVFASTTSHEGADRETLDLDGNANQLIPAIGQAQKKTVVALVNPGPITSEWRTSVPAIITNHMPGQEYGNALMDVVFGRVNPSARLTITYPAANQTVLSPDQWPGVNKETSYYSEKLEVGYRFYDAHNWTPAFPFGHGLSYTSFTYSDLSVDSSAKTVSFTLKNSGSVDGAEVSQLYLGFPTAAGEPPAQLRRFERVELAAGASTHVSFQLADRDFSIWDVAAHDWSVVKGSFTVSVGASSRDTRLKGSLTV